MELKCFSKVVVLIIFLAGLCEGYVETEGNDFVFLVGRKMLQSVDGNQHISDTGGAVLESADDTEAHLMTRDYKETPPRRKSPIHNRETGN